MLIAKQTNKKTRLLLAKINLQIAQLLDDIHKKTTYHSYIFPVVYVIIKYSLPNKAVLRVSIFSTIMLGRGEVL